jgi:hypothetical protein
MATNTTVEFANVLPEIWSNTWYPVLKAKTPMMNFFGQEWASDLNVGDTVNVPQMSALTGEVISAGAAEDVLTPEALTISKIPIVVNKIYAATVDVSSLADLQSIAYQNMLRDELTSAVAQKIEAAVIAALVPSASAPDHDIAPAVASYLNATDVAGMRKLLSLQHVAPEDRALFVDPSFYSDLLGQTVFASADFVPAGSPSASGAISSPVYGFTVVEADKLSADVGYACHKSCFSMIYQKSLQIKISDLHAASKLAYRITAYLVAGMKLLDNKRLVKISG